ncbi:MerR family transcriptional regulator [Lentilactobacillus senioris]|uniref:MerR family transcriptional regulator n=1 Tax=Lentilactobacillus senioris TaxID=931534 RepID=UPI003D28A5CA
MYKISDIADKMDVSVDTVRYYDREGLMPFVERDKSGRRVFTDHDLNFIEVIQCMKQAGIPVKEIATFIDWCMTGDETLEQRYDFLADHEQQLETKIQQLEDNLAFLRWKKWYYQTAMEAGTEDIHFLDGTNIVDPNERKRYEKQLSDGQLETK